MEKSGSVNHNGKVYFYELDENGYVWIKQNDGTRFNVGQVRPLTPSDNIVEVVHDMLHGAGY